jgi:hypothetical protein
MIFCGALSMPSSLSILIYGHNFELLKLRKLVLETTGASVWATTGMKRLEERFLLQKIDLLIR